TFSCFGDGAVRFDFTSYTDGFGVTRPLNFRLQTLCGISQALISANDGSGLMFFAKLDTVRGTIQQVSLYDRAGNQAGADTNGNEITGSFSNDTTTWTDTLGTSVWARSGALPTYTFTYQGPSGPLSYTVQYSTFTLQ